MFVTAILFALSSCDDCERAACDAVVKPVTDAAIPQGVAGVISYQSDAVENGCAECTYSQADIAIWATSALVSSVAEADSVAHSGDADYTIRADRRYEQALEPANYLVCATSSLSTICAAITVSPDETWTVNLATTYGPGRMIVFAPGSQAATDSSVFEILTYDR